MNTIIYNNRDFENMKTPYEKFVIDREHEQIPITGVKPDGYPFQNFTDYTTSWDWNRLDNELCLMMSQADLSQYPKVSGPQPPELQYGEFPREDTHDKYPLNIMELTEQQRRKYLYFKRQSVLPWYFVINLKPAKFEKRAFDFYDWDSKYNVPYTKECVEQLPFKEIGRVVIYASWATSVVPCHRDDPPSENYDQMITFNPGGYRPVYIYDSMRQKKRHLPEDWKAYSYNTTDYHGVDSVPHFSYTVRVDGQFK